MDKIEYIAKNYNELKRRHQVAETRLRNYKPISENDVIESLVFAKSDQERVTKTTLGNRSESIALQYREKFEEEDAEFLEALLRCYFRLERDLDTFDCCVKFLKPELKELAHDFLSQEFSWKELEQKYGVSHSTLAYRRQKVFKEIRRYYCTLGHSIEFNELDYYLPLY